VTAGARSARVRVTRPDGTIALDREVSLVEGEEGATRFPLRIPVVPVGNDAARRFVLEAVVIGDAGRTLGDVRISTTFLAGAVAEVVGCFADRCAGVDCGACDTDDADAGAS